MFGSVEEDEPDKELQVSESVVQCRIKALSASRNEWWIVDSAVEMPYEIGPESYLLDLVTWWSCVTVAETILLE